MSETRRFHIGDIMSITNDVLLSPEHIGGVYKILGWLIDDDGIMTHQLPRVSRECQPFLREQFPDLAAIEYDGSVHDEETLKAYLDRLEPTYGTHRDVPRLPVQYHTDIDPLTELQMMRPNLDIHVIRAEEL